MMNDIDFSIYDGKSENEITKMLGYTPNIREMIEVLKELKILPDDYEYLRAVICMEIDMKIMKKLKRIAENNLLK